MASGVRQVSVIYGYFPTKISRKKVEPFIRAHAADQGMDFSIPVEPIARFWCHPAPAGSPLPWCIGWTAPVADRRSEATVERHNVVLEA